jgi:hypothetical protein
VSHARLDRLGLGLALALPVVACTTGEPQAPADSETTTAVDPTAADGPATTAATAATTSSMVTGDASTGGASTSEAVTDGTSADTLPPADVPPLEPKSCALAVIDPAADPAAVIDAGDGVDQIPTSVGEALLRNCGCHYTDDVPIGLYVDYVSNDQPLSTLADFHGNFMGTFPMGFERMPAYEAVEERVVYSNPLPMPPFGCGVEGEPGRISAADLELFTDWLAAGAPDGASFP